MSDGFCDAYETDLPGLSWEKGTLISLLLFKLPVNGCSAFVGGVCQ